MITVSTKQAYQRGAALVISLIILALMTLIGVTAIQVSTQQEKMVANARDSNNAFQAAESALRRAEQLLYDTDMSTIFPTAACANGYCIPKCKSVGNRLDTNNPVVCDSVNTTPPKAQWETLNWESTASQPPYQTYNGGDPTTASDDINALPSVARQPRYIIEDITPLSGGKAGVVTRWLYRVTALGYGAAQDDNGIPLARVMLQTIYQK